MTQTRDLAVRPRVAPLSTFAELQQSFPSRVSVISPFVDQLMQFLRPLIHRFRNEDQDELDIEIAVREAIANAVVHGNHEDPQKRVDVNCRCTIDGDVLITLRDEGQGLFSAVADGSTSLLDAVYYASQRIRRGNAVRKALVLISDGDDNSSRYTEFEVRNLLQESDAQLFAIGLYKRVPADTEHREALIGRTLMTRLAEVTGGFQYPVQNPNELRQVAATISALMRNQYILAYRPTNQQADGKYRRVTVKLAQPAGRAPCRAYWRAGYYAPDLLQ